MNKADLQQRLTELELFLRAHNVRYTDVIGSLSRLLESDPGVEVSPDLLDATRALFAGAGSLNDVYISKRNGHAVDDEGEANRQLEFLVSELWRIVEPD